MNYRVALNDARVKLNKAGVPDADLDAWYILSYVTGMTRSQFILNQFDEISEADLLKFSDLVEKRSQRIPYQHLVGTQEFMGLTFKVNEHVLIPRQDTETLVEEALKVVPDGGRVLDVCTGSGCILLSILSLKDGLYGEAVDISDEALEVAKENANRLSKTAKIYKSDLFSAVEGHFDVIVSNPPYIRSEVIEGLEPEVRDHEPRLALDGTDDGLYFYRRISSEAANYLSDGGYLLYEIGHDQGADVARLLTEANFMDVRIIKDLAGNDRVVSGQL